MKIIPRLAQKTTIWSGGLTTELYIYPEASSYTERNFDFRLSTATVEIKTSVFTPLTNVNRTLMVLDGKMELVHKSQHQVVLGPLDVDNFDGGWETTSKGTCIDFNLMCMNETTGTVEGVDLKIDDTVEINTNSTHCFVYLFKGTIRLGDERIETGSLVKLSRNSTPLIRVENNSRLAIIQIS